VDHDLLVNNWVYKRLRHEMGIRLIFCASEALQRRVIRLILDIGLSSHIVETVADVSGGMKMSFKQPIFGPQRINLLLAAIWELNDLTGECGTRETGVDRPKDGNPLHGLDRPLPGQRGGVRRAKELLPRWTGRHHFSLRK
jgi:hypothetical protein